VSLVAVSNLAARLRGICFAENETVLDDDQLMDVVFRFEGWMQTLSGSVSMS
jgi:hypothetical protein